MLGLPSLWSLACFATMLNVAFRGTRVFDPESLGGWQRDSVREVGVVTGCLLLVPTRLWRELGGFDLRFFMYGEDADLSIRASRRGLRPAITPDAVVTHEVGVSSSARPDKLLLLFSGKATLLRKHWRSPKRELGLGLLLAGVGLRALLARVARRSSADSAWVALWRARRRWLPGYDRSFTAAAVGASPAARHDAGGSVWSAVRWAFALTFGRRAFSTIFTFVLAALLGPHDFGLVAMALIYITLLAWSWSRASRRPSSSVPTPSRSTGTPRSGSTSSGACS